MKIERPQAERLDSKGYLKDIERAARVCYCSEPNGNTEDFVEKLVRNKHGRPLEFGTVYLALPYNDEFSKHIDFFDKNRYSKVELYNGIGYITTNYRVLVESKKLHLIDKSLMYNLDCPNDSYHYRASIKWTVSRGIADEFRTHTMISSLMQSTRYCNYSKNKFGNQVTFIRPSWFDDNKNRFRRIIMKTAWWFSEKFYFLLIKMGCKAQEARDVLPLGVKTELIQTGFGNDWNNFFHQRTSKAAHPDARYIAGKVKEYVF